MTIKRKALLIAYPGKSGVENYCNGVFKDVENFEEFLLSPIGGYWKNEELDILKSPSKDTVRSYMNLLKSYDYALVVFTGHGWHSGELNETMLQINDKEDISSKELRTGAPKQTLILDCCREIHEELLEKSLMMSSQKNIPQIHPGECRKYYDKRIEECSEALTLLYSCNVNETAGEDSNGGYFSHNLIESSRDWASNSDTDTTRNYAILSVVRAFSVAEENVKIRSGNRQHPQIERPRSEKQFPFCVVA